MRYWALQGTGETLWPSDDDYFNGTCAGNGLFAVHNEGWLFALWIRVPLPRSSCCAQSSLHRHVPWLVDVFLVLHNLCTAIIVMWINHQLFTRRVTTRHLLQIPIAGKAIQAIKNKTRKKVEFTQNRLIQYESIAILLSSSQRLLFF